MKLYRGLLLMLALAAAGAFAWQWLDADPGYVLVSWRQTSLETTLIVATLALLAMGWVLATGWRLLRAPGELWRRRRQRQAELRLAGGLLALEDGRWARADRALSRAADEPRLRVPALLAAARAAFARGHAERAEALLVEAAQAGGEAQVRVLRAERLLAAGKPQAVCELLAAPAARGELTPRGVQIYLRALVADGRAEEALAHWPALRASGLLDAEAKAALETELLAAALLQSADGEAVLVQWKALSRRQRLQPALVEAFAARAGQYGLVREAATAIERALKKHADERIARRYGTLAHADRAAAIRFCERQLETHPDSAGLRLSLGRLCRAEKLWGKAEQYLQEALAWSADPDVWEALAELHADQGDDDRARQAYANALRSARGEAVAELRRIRHPIIEPVGREERSSMGVPQLPAG